jgi:beta-lactam-binding protein with PASTA domain
MQSIGIKKIRKRLKQQPILTHFVLAILAFCIVIFLVLKGLNVYTHHGKAITIPNVKGLQIEEASVFFANSGLRYNIIDSVYTNEVKPGAILEAIPTFGSKVKKGRIVFITINAKNAQMAAIPDIKNISFRQAYALIKAQGFTSVETKYVAGRYKDLVIGVELNGRNLEKDDLVPLSSALILKISDGESQSNSDETQTEGTETVEEN